MRAPGATGAWGLAVCVALAPRASAHEDDRALVVDGALHVGAPAVVEITLGEAGPPSDWSLSTPGAQHRVLQARGRVGRVLVVPEAGAREVVVAVGAAGAPRRFSLPVVPEPPPSLRVEPVTGEVRARSVRMRVTGPVPPREALQVVLGEGRVAAVEEVEGGLELVFEPSDDPYPRVVPLGVRDLRGTAPPAWGSVRLRARPSVPVRTTPGSRVTLSIGGRTWGPVTVPASGEVTIPVVQEAEDRVARLRLQDPSGNETVRTFPLGAGRAPPVLAFVDGAWQADAPAPSVWLRLPVDEAAPIACQAPSVGSLAVTPLPGRPGQARVALPLALPRDTWELRVRCEAPGVGEVAFSVPAAEGVPTGLRVRVWPEVLSADQPLADVAVALENALGERVEPRGRVVFTAQHGEIVPVAQAGVGMRAEYRGHVVQEVGEDTLGIRWFAPAGDGPVAAIEVASLGLGAGGTAVVGVRAVDALARPIGAARVQVAADAGPRAEAWTGTDGWASLVLPGLGAGVHALTVQAGGDASARTVRALIDPAAVDGRGPGAPDLVRDVVVQLDPGRVAQIDVSLGARKVTPSSRGVEVVARFLDRTGLPARDPAPTLEADEGTVSAPLVREDGAVAWTWRPGPGLRPRDVVLRAGSDALDLHEEVRLRVAPALVWRVVGVSASMHTNFGRLLAPAVHLDGEWRVRLGASSSREPDARGVPGLMVRAGVGWYGAASAVDVVSESDAALRMDLVPITVAALFRQEYPLQAFWLGLGLAVAPWFGSARAGDVLLDRRAGVLSPGLAAVAGYGLRVPGGEIGLEARLSTLSSPGTAASFRGFVGGLAIGASYRVAYGRVSPRRSRP